MIVLFILHMREETQETDFVRYTNLQAKAPESRVEFPSISVWSVWGWKVSHSLR